MKGSKIMMLQAGITLVCTVIAFFRGAPADTVSSLGIITCVVATGSVILRKIEEITPR